jgi:hypothetical protein
MVINQILQLNLKLIYVKRLEIIIKGMYFQLNKSFKK